MGLRVYREPDLSNPYLIAAWPGIGNIGFIAVDTLRRALQAEAFAEIEPWHYFYPRGVLIQSGELMDMNFPKSRFFYKKLDGRDCIFFVGEEQPSGGRKAYEVADLILDLASLFGCKRVYTAAAAVTATHHKVKPRVWATPNSEDMLEDIRHYPNTVPLSEVEGRGGEGSITGMNGLLLGVARKRGLNGACLLGEIPVYISQFLTPYPRASRSIVEVLSHVLGITPDLSRLDEMTQDVDQNLERFYEMIPPEVRERLDQLKDISNGKGEAAGPITDDEKREIMQNIEDLFNKGGQED